jgi:hypothetical protein
MIVIVIVIVIVNIEQGMPFTRVFADMDARIDQASSSVHL